MRKAVVVAGLFIVVAAAAGCGGGSVEHERFESPQFSGKRTRIHVRSQSEPSRGYRGAEGQPVRLHVHTGNGQSTCIEIKID